MTIQQYLELGHSLSVPTCVYTNAECTDFLGHISSHQPNLPEFVNVLTMVGEDLYVKLYPTTQVYIVCES